MQKIRAKKTENIGKANIFALKRNILVSLSLPVERFSDSWKFIAFNWAGELNQF